MSIYQTVGDAVSLVCKVKSVAAKRTACRAIALQQQQQQQRQRPSVS